jgi:hypothetical protein
LFVCLFVCLSVCLRGGLLNFGLCRPSRREGRFSRLYRSLGIAFCSSRVHNAPYCTYRGALADREPNVLANRGLPCVTGVTAAHAGVVFGVCTRTRSQTLTCRHKRAHPHTHKHTNHGRACAQAQVFRVVTTAALLKSQASQEILGNETVAKVTAGMADS